MTSVSSTYAHVRKSLTSAAGIEVPGLRLKWYDLHRAELDIPEEVSKEAREFVTATAGGISPAGELGFVILHRVGDAYLILVSTWRNDNELWETVYLKEAGDFELVPFPDRAKGTYCVWELGAVLHEQQAWIRYLFSSRDAAAQEAYLADTHPGAMI